MSLNKEEQALLNYIIDLNEGENFHEPLCEEIEVWHTCGVNTPDELDAYIAPMPREDFLHTSGDYQDITELEQS